MNSDPPVIRLSVDRQLFEIRQDPERPGLHHFDWLSGPNEGYGFSSMISTHQPMSRAQLEAAVRNFLDQVDRTTGYIE